MNRSITTIILSAAIAAITLTCAATDASRSAASTSTATAEARAAPSLKIGGRADTSVYLQSLDVQADTVGNVVTTRHTMVFKNRTGGILEGELTFPLPDGATITGHALDINDAMREAVPVERSKATQVFEEIQQRAQVIDPSVLERAEGNNFRVRIYPFPAYGTRTVSITYEEEITLGNRTQIITQSAADGDGGTFLVTTAPNMRTRKKRWDSDLAIIWDASLSGSRRDMRREMDALNIIFAANRNAVVHLYLLNNRFKKSVNRNWSDGGYRVINGNWNELKMVLETTPFDGGTDFSKIDLGIVHGKEILFFSDGMSTLSDAVLEMRNAE